MKLKGMSIGLSGLVSTSLAGGQVDFGAYYTRLNTGADWEAYSRTGPDADIVVRLPKAGGQLVFWRGNSYLPYWKTDQGQWDLEAIVPRSGDGTKAMPDRVDAFSHAEILENRINRVAQAATPDFRQGVNLDNDGTYTLIVWVGLSANTPQEFEIVAP